MIKRMIMSAAATVMALAACSNEPPPRVYQAIPVVQRDIVVSARAAGVIEPITTVEVKSKASGEIVQVAVETGDAVRPGQLLVRVDPRGPRLALTQAEADLEVAQAQLTNARSQLRRAEELYASQAITEQEYEAARLQAANANASLVRADRALEDAKIAFEDTDVRAPISGIIIQRGVEVGTVITSATREVGGGTVLLQMANLDTVQVRALVDETDIGKIESGMDVTITVDAFPQQPFRGTVLKIEPQAQVQQNVTMFPVLVQIANPGLRLKPGMNAEVEMHVGERRNVVAVPVAALRTQRDVASAAIVLGLDPDAVGQQLARADSISRATLGGATAGDTERTAPRSDNVFRGPDGREIQLPPGVTAQQVQALFTKMRSGGGMQSLTTEERALLQRVMGAAGRGGPGMGGGMRAQQRAANGFEAGGSYIVFVLRDGEPVPVRIQTGLSDLDYAEVRSGLTTEDTVLVLPSQGLLASQEEWRARMQQVRGTGLPGVQRR